MTRDHLVQLHTVMASLHQFYGVLRQVQKLFDKFRYASAGSEFASYSRQCDDLHDIRLGVCTARAIDGSLSDFGKDNLHAENP